MLAAILSLTLLFVSCKDSDSKKDPALIQNGAVQQAANHEIRDYFKLESYAEDAAYSEIMRIDGKIIDEDREHNLIAVETEELNVYNEIVKTVKVYDLASGEVINTLSQSNDYGTALEDQTILTVDLHYPLIRASRGYYEEGSFTEYHVSYYLAKKDGATEIHSTEIPDFEIDYYENGLVACFVGDQVLWIDQNMETVRTIDAVIANGYEIDEFDAEYKGYVYAWDQHSIQVFNRAGMCCAEYKTEKDSTIFAHVLNNGNVLIQKLTEVDEYTACDVIDLGTRYAVTSYVMNFLDGRMTEVDLSFMVAAINTAYEEENNLPFALADGRQNQALIRRFAEEKYAVDYEYVVLSNELTVEYTLKNTTPGVQITHAQALNANYYIAPVKAGGTTQYCIFDLDGNKIARCSAENANTRFIITDNAIYDYNMTLVYDIDANGYELMGVDTASSNVFLGKFNFETGEHETFLFDGKEEAPVLLANGSDVSYVKIHSGTYTTEENETALQTLCDANGQTFLVVLDSFDVAEFDRMLVIETEFEGARINYVLK